MKIDQTETSDNDIYYEGPALGLKSLSGLPQALSEYLGASVDVVREHEGLNSSLRNRIMREVISVFPNTLTYDSPYLGMRNN